MVMITSVYGSSNEGDTLAETFNFFVISMALFYVVARLYLVVNCFVNLAPLLDKVFELPNWSHYFPHIA